MHCFQGKSRKSLKIDSNMFASSLILPQNWFFGRNYDSCVEQNEKFPFGQEKSADEKMYSSEYLPLRNYIPSGKQT